MTNSSEVPASTDVLRSLNCLRSDDPLVRQTGIKVLSALLDDPRVRQVFEHLYQHDSDPDVRALAWQALSGAAPSIPGPEPEPSAGDRPGSTRAPSSRGAGASRGATPQRAATSHAVRRKRTTGAKPTGTPFLLDARHARRVARWRKNAQSGGVSRPSRWRWGVGLLLIGIGLLWGAVLFDWVDWWMLRESGVVVQGEVIGADVRGDDGFFVYVQYPYPVASRSLALVAEQRVVEHDFNQLGLATPVAVRYVPDRPDLVRLEGIATVHTQRDVLTVVAAGLTVVLLVGMIWARVRRRSPSRSAQLVQGRVVKCRGVADDDGEYTVILRYRFRTPAGRVIVDQVGQVRNDWRDRKLPVPGTPVVVEYRSDSVYHLL